MNKAVQIINLLFHWNLVEHHINRRFLKYLIQLQSLPTVFLSFSRSVRWRNHIQTTGRSYFFAAPFPIIDKALTRFLLMITSSQTPLNGTCLFLAKSFFRWSVRIHVRLAAFACIHKRHFYENSANNELLKSNMRLTLR